jgi:cysteine desulfurase/selenocysteine lyase
MDLARIREDFPITREDRIYLNNASLCPLPTPVVAAVARALDEQSRCGEDPYWEWLKVAEETQAQCARLVNADADEIALVENTGTGMNIVANMLNWSAGDNVVVNDLEFFPYQWFRLRKLGVEVRAIRSEKPDGTRDVTISDLQAICDEKTKAIIVSQVAFVNGLRYDLEAVGKLAKQCGAYLVVDGIQSVGALQFDVREGPVDFLCCGGHKWLLGPLGTGFFFCRHDLIERFEPVYVGWRSHKSLFEPGWEHGGFRADYELASTARKFMPGNFNMAGVVGLHAGTKYLLDIGMENIQARNMALADQLVAGIQNLGLRFLSPMRPAARSHIINFVPTDCERTVQALRDARIDVSPRLGGIRVSPNFFNEEWEIARLLEVVANAEGV